MRKIIFFLAVSVIVLFHILVARASVLTMVRDIINDSAPGAFADHVIEFTVTGHVPAQGKIIIIPEGGFSIQDNFGYDDVDILAGANRVMITDNNLDDQQSVTDSCGVTISTATGESGKIAIIMCDDIEAGSKAVIKIRGLRNPFLPGSYRVRIETRDEQEKIVDSAAAMVAILDRVFINSKSPPPPKMGGGPIFSKSAIPAPPSVSLPAKSDASVGSIAKPSAGDLSRPLIIVSPVVISAIRKNMVVKFDYSYSNTGATPLKVKVVRQLLNSKGRVVKTVSAVKQVPVGKKFNVNVREPLGKNFPAGHYTVDIKIIDTSTGKTIGKNIFNVVKKEKMLILREVAGKDPSIYFDKHSLTTIENGVVGFDSAKIKYGFFNKNKVPMILKIERSLIDAQKNKIIDKHWGKWVVGGNQGKTVEVDQRFGEALGSGFYLMRVRAYDWVSGTLVSEGSLKFEVVEK